MPSPVVFAILFFLPAFALNSDDDSWLELDSTMRRLAKMSGAQDRLREIRREGGRAVITLGIFPALQYAENIERFLERNEVFAAGFGATGRAVVYLAELYLNSAELGPRVRKALVKGVVEFRNWLAGMSHRGLISYDANEEPPAYVKPGTDPSTEELRQLVEQTLRQLAEYASGAFSDDEHYALVPAFTRLLALLCIAPADAEPSVVDKLVRTQRYAAAHFRLVYRHPQKTWFEDTDRALLVEYVQQIWETSNDPIQELLPNASVSTSESRLNEYVYSTIAVAFVIIATLRHGGTIVAKLKKTSKAIRRYGRTVVEKLKETSNATRRYGETIVAKLKETSKGMYESIDVFSRLRDGRRADALHEKVVECDQLHDANAVLNETLDAMQGRLRSLEEEIVHCEAFKEQASAREAQLKSEVDSLRSVAEQCVQHERLQEEHYAQAREISRRKEAAVKERLDEQCLISESLNDAVEEMQRLITAMIEANEAMATASLQAGVQGTAPNRDVSTEARQATSRPDVPVDPVTNAVTSTTTTRDDDAVQRFVTTVYTTLYSLPHGYDSIARLLRDLSEDSGLDGETVACELGYESFEAFLHSPEMAPRILVGALPVGRPRYKVYPTKSDLERYVDQQLGTDYGDTKRALARQREENNRLRRHLASTMERVEKLKSEALAKHQPIPVLDSSRFMASSSKTHTSADDTKGILPGTDPASRFRPADSKKNVDGPSTSRTAYERPAPPSGSGQTSQEESTLARDAQRHIDELERMVHCAICMDRPKDTAFACGHAYCHECAVELGKCTFGCKKQNGKPLTFKYRVFL
ncbi:hypothetical protein AAVH_19804 [Aphelenchoides avenae]|nr:hypothetical protein AAVH_19804 [Aphelenchus avenae]